MRTGVVTAAAAVMSALLCSTAEARRAPCPLGQYFRPSLGICQHHPYGRTAGEVIRRHVRSAASRRRSPAVRVVVRTRYRTLVKVVRVLVPTAPNAPALPSPASAERPSDAPPPSPSSLLWAGRLPSARFGPPIRSMPQS